jgi:Enoyl-(Acyl carrier protein) reductase
MPLAVAYTVSKHGIIGLTRSAAFMYGPRGVRVNAVAPGGVATGIPMPATVSEYGSARMAPFHSLIPSVATAAQLAARIPAQRRRGQHQRRDLALGRRLVGAVATLNIEYETLQPSTSKPVPSCEMPLLDKDSTYGGPARGARRTDRYCETSNESVFAASFEARTIHCREA